jgi:hypothetical protein
MKVLLKIISAWIGAAAVASLLAVLWATWQYRESLRQIGPGPTTADLTRILAGATVPFLVKAFGVVQLWRLRRSGLVVTFGVCAASLVGLGVSAALDLVPMRGALIGAAEPLIVGSVLLLPAAGRACSEITVEGREVTG